MVNPIRNHSSDISHHFFGDGISTEKSSNHPQMVFRFMALGIPLLLLFSPLGNLQWRATFSPALLRCCRVSPRMSLPQRPRGHKVLGCGSQWFRKRHGGAPIAGWMVYKKTSHRNRWFRDDLEVYPNFRTPPVDFWWPHCEVTGITVSKSKYPNV